MLNNIKAGAQLGHYRLVYFDEAGFAASPPVQYGWSPRGKPLRLSLKTITDGQFWAR
ncbi:hypothetical protein XBO1_2530005 [Xenorhabdus bovienii str. oregonense]|uniref:Uncharacterized protein n=1 Tax=Xenorhabdus bovienii str. oregonense TaxID=1398202 RepID=A0A077PBL0_XENBV|nr:hypothetical protein [Xenorhabdus bovienii]CDH07091.1 hypothetical protein XBO1_2530005 [Xenorhabdus bovienii str. oregonense]